MATPRRKPRNRRPVERPSVRRGREGGLRKLPPELDDLASGRRRRLGPPRRPAGLDDPRIAGLIAGVKNREARAVLDARSDALRRTFAPGSEPEREGADDERAAARALCEAQRLGLWRAGRFTSFDAWAEHALGLPPRRARELAEQGARELDCSLERLPEPLVALWMRAEAALLRSCPQARVEIVGDGREAALALRLPAASAQDALRGLEELGQAAAGLLRLLTSRPNGSTGGS